MDSRAIPCLHSYLEAASASADPAEQACAQNVLLDERPPVAALALYQPYFLTGSISGLDDWYGRHRGYATEHLFIDQDEPLIPYTFRDINCADILLRKSRPRSRRFSLVTRQREPTFRVFATPGTRSATNARPMSPLRSRSRTAWPTASSTGHCSCATVWG